MTNLQKCTRCKSEIDISYFGINRKKQPYKTCVNCRSKPKTPRNDKPELKRSDEDFVSDENDQPITPQHYDQVDKEMRGLFEKQFGINSHDTTYKYFTEEEQVERYANMLAFWDIHRPDGEKVMQSTHPKEAAKMFYISNMRTQTLNKIERFHTSTQDKIRQRYNYLMALHNERVLIEDFIKSNKYPTYDEAMMILRRLDDTRVVAEYAKFNHEMMSKVWENLFDEEKMKVVGNLINQRGGFSAMTHNHCALMTILKNFIKQNKLSRQDQTIVQCNVYKIIEVAWHGIGEWLM